MDSLSENIKLLRKSKELKQDELAKILGVSRVTITRYENGTREPDNEMLIKLASFFDVSIDTLLGIEDDEIGRIIKEECEEQNFSEKELADILGVSVKKLLQYESGEIPIDEEIIPKFENAFGLNYYELLDKYNLYDEYIPEHFNGDIQAWENFKKAQDKDVEEENAIEYEIKKSLISNFYKLNHTGQQEASKRIEELTYIDKYKK